ncbi:hypothetical protein [Sphingomonas sp. PAMC 26605]|uniref:hypothetical protein n=1 Tax=Sphingomonas sp. PAMC 26605 TaxID=1112214 RepID=UPI0012F4958F|nr:hypothetical protein [Sphingomonas sp. PAMC 26605]
MVVSPDGEITQDSVDIVDRFEDGDLAASAYPPGARQRLLAVLLQCYGNQGLLRHAMHFRWAYLEEQRRFLDHAFGAAGGDPRAELVMRRMQAYLPGLRVTDATIPLIEASFDQLLGLLDAHFTVMPYLFGGWPSVGD